MLKPEEKKFLGRAVELSKQGMESGQGGPFGCVVVKNGQIIGEGNNKVTSSNDPTAHAEVVAIREACKKLGATSWMAVISIQVASLVPCALALFTGQDPGESSMPTPARKRQPSSLMMILFMERSMPRCATGKFLLFM